MKQISVSMLKAATVDSLSALPSTWHGRAGTGNLKQLQRSLDNPKERCSSLLTLKIGSGQAQWVGTPCGR